ncbi:MAG: hypothetical protein ACRERC_03160 [Candidatus Binatia bacterium]
MSTIRPLVLAGLALCAASAAGAISTYSAPIRSSEGDNLGCQVQNLSAAAVEVSTTIENGLGTTIDPKTFAVPAGRSVQLSFTQSAVFGAYCTFTFEADPAVRGFISLQDAGGSNTRLLYDALPIDDSLPATAQTIVSPPVRSSQGDNLICRAMNVSAAPVQVISTLFDSLGAVVETQDLTIPAGDVRGMSSSNTAIFGGYCRFQFEANPTAVRGYIELEDAGGSNTRLLLPALSVASAPDVPTATPTPVDTELPVPTPTATPTGPLPPACCGDCNGSGEVTINELIIAVGNSLNGCPTE